MTAQQTPVTMVGLVHPKAGIGAQEFHDRWRHPHVEMVRGIRPIRHYVQHHRITSALVPDEEPAYLGVAELWFDSLADGESLASDPQYREHVEPDERGFVEQSRGVAAFMTEDVVRTHDELPVDAPVYVTLWQLVRDRSLDWTREESLALSERLGASRHVVNRSVRPDSPIAIARQFSWPTASAFERTLATAPDAVAALRQVPGSFLLLARSERAF